MNEEKLTAADGCEFSEPVECGEEVYRDEHFRLRRKWKWDVKSLYEDEETGLYIASMSERASDRRNKYTFVSKDGKCSISRSFDYIDNFREGMSRVCDVYRGYGFIDTNMNFVVPMRYEYAQNFRNGKAIVKKSGNWYYVDKTGREVSLDSDGKKQYQSVGCFFDGLCIVSTLVLKQDDLAYHSDNNAGIWGYVNEKGEEVIRPQYIYAYDFSGGIAFACKGKWTIDKKWDNEYKQGKYWTEEEKWGAIDTSGKEVIPFIFDEIKHFNDTEEAFMAHYGGWENGHWGVIDNRGNWLAEPIFEYIGYEYRDGLFTFSYENSWDDVPEGIYDINQGKVLFEPQFLDVFFCDDGYISVVVFDEELGRTVERIIDVNGKEKFHSVYSSIYEYTKPYQVSIHDSEGFRSGLIDEDGTVILPCKYNVPWNGISYKNKRIVFIKDDKQGLADFDDNVTVEPVYSKIYNIDKLFPTVCIENANSRKEGLITANGAEVLPAVYKSISLCRDNHIICCGEGFCEVYVLEEV